MIQDILAEDGKQSYRVFARCSNCGIEGGVDIDKGTTVSEMKCPRCGCQHLRREPYPRSA
jgi:predicted RNA-binding Zn-ribbon protein involved in translation (DUF1610 family)